jgi:hypothetical protein
VQTSYPRFGPADLTTIEGVTEGVPHDAFLGWVWNTRNPEAELAVEIVGPGFYARILANNHRYDLADAGKRGGNCLFKMLVPAGMSEEAQAETGALLAGTSHRLRSTAEASRTVDANWLDTQPLELQSAVNAQRIRFGLGLPPLSEEHIEGIVEAADQDGFDLSRLVEHVVKLSG